MLRRTLDELVTACHHAVLAEIAETGLAGLSMEGVARRARVARTSIYRHWRTIDDLLLHALTTIPPVAPGQPLGTELRADLLRSLEQLVDWLGGPHAPAIHAILNERHRRPDLSAALAEIGIRTSTGDFTRTVLNHYVALGHIDAGTVTPVVAAIGEALVIKHRIDSGALPDSATLQAIVDQAILPAVG